VIVVSIPDYAYTFVGSGKLQSYEMIITTLSKSIATKITLSLALLTLRKAYGYGLVAQDGLHPSESLFIICRANSPVLDLKQIKKADASGLFY
jgi:hypothetical protein